MDLELLYIRLWLLPIVAIQQEWMWYSIFCMVGLISWQGVPLLYVPLEAIMSKYYGESERALGKVFNTANDLQNGAIIFLDEVEG